MLYKTTKSPRNSSTAIIDFYVTDNEESLKTHQQTHDKKFVCVICNRRYYDGDHLTQHQKLCHPFDPKPRSFKDCIFTYRTPIQLTEHMETHSTEGRRD
ncbi:predicted protein [Lichtheimia corymbifera JMRC:FSU:9682]|uniref:C2H2-type domain-containing protein n=1 Tax=Lichtheimia corymbifera JMRC:FSU:9682 TaxID=1263082 RepID=A0A068RKY9_9FUNG|nr:predicted protein [Lichtheimia corymbifera JMRC:FSU:9682]